MTLQLKSIIMSEIPVYSNSNSTKCIWVGWHLLPTGPNRAFPEQMFSLMHNCLDSTKQSFKLEQRNERKICENLSIEHWEMSVILNSQITEIVSVWSFATAVPPGICSLRPPPSFGISIEFPVLIVTTQKFLLCFAFVA